MLMSELANCSLLAFLEPEMEPWPPSLSLQAPIASSWKLSCVLDPRLLFPACRDAFWVEALRRPRLPAGELLRFLAALDIGRDGD